MAAEIPPHPDAGIKEARHVVIYEWTLILEGPWSLPDPVAVAAVDQVERGLGPFLADLQVVLSAACRTPLVLRADD